MKNPSENGNGRVPSRTKAREGMTIERPGADHGSLRVTVIADHEMETHLGSLGAMLEQNHPDMAAFLKTHGRAIRSVMTAALDGAVQAERRRLTWLLHNDLAALLSAARERLSVVLEESADESVREALREIDVCLCSAAKATRGLISDLGPASLNTKME